MNILIDGQTLVTPEINRGIGVYFTRVIESILNNDLTNEFFILAERDEASKHFSSWASDKLHYLSPVGFTATARHDGKTSRGYSRLVNETIRSRNIDLYWCPNPLMLNAFLPANDHGGCFFAATIFDLIPAVMEKDFRRHWPAQMFQEYEQRLHLLETDYDVFLHISQHTKSDFLRMLDVSGKKHFVTPLAADEAFRPYAFPQIPDGERYILYPGGFDPRKNMDRTLEAFAAIKKKYPRESIAETDLVIVCHKDEASEAEMRKRARRLGIDGHLKLTGFLSNAELIGLYQKARCLFFPSLYEGFGLPILEGLACGLPIAASNSSSIPEVAGDFAQYFDPFDVDGMTNALYAALQQSRDLESRQRRHQYARQFSWEQTAQKSLAAFTDIVNTGIDSRNQETAPATSETTQPTAINVRDLIAQLSVEELCRTADEFFARLNNWDYLHAKPFAAINETPELLFCFAKIVQGLNLLPDMTILDFGAGSCWTSRFLTQMGLEVIACDVSKAALEIGQDLYRRLPIIGDQPAPRFLQFDGHRFDLPDVHVDRISCLDAFHHVPNQQEVLNEMARILKPGGIAGFSEPGPKHSQSPQSQYEMRTNRVIENDIDVHEIWSEAQAAGFTEMKIAFFNPNPLLLSLDEFTVQVNGVNTGERYVAETREEMWHRRITEMKNASLNPNPLLFFFDEFTAHLDEADTSERYVAETREEMRHRRLFFLFKGEANTAADSRQREGLMCRLDVELVTTRIGAGEKLQLAVTATNTGSNIWLPATARVGAVRFGIHLFDENGVLMDLDYFRHNLTPDPGRQVPPGETIKFDVEVPMPPQGKYSLQFDLVSEAVCWFEHNGAPTVRSEIDVL